MPRAVKARTSYLDPSANVFNFEACYTDELHELRHAILKHREAAHFESDLLISEDSWFNKDFETAFTDVNQKSYLLSSRYKPRQKLSLNDFRVKDYRFGIFKWRSLVNVEKDLGDFLLMRNHKIAKHQPEHLNDPMNFFFYDIKRMTRALAHQQNTEIALQGINSLLNYINHVETELPYDDQDRVFISQIRNSLTKQVKPQVLSRIENSNLRQHFESLMRKLESVIDTSNGITHFSFQDSEVNSHPLLDSEAIDPAEIARFPTRALIECANKIAVDEYALAQISKKHSSSILEISDNPFYEVSNNEYQVKPNVDLLTHCQDVRLMTGLTEENKADYITAVSNINNLLGFHEVLKQVLNLFDEAGQFHLIQEFNSELTQLITALHIEIEQTQQNIDKIVQGNELIKNEILKKNLEDGSLGILAKIASSIISFSKEKPNAEQFVKNQDVRHLIQSKDSLEHYTKALDSTTKLIDMLGHSKQKYATPETQKRLADFGKGVSSGIEKLVGNAGKLYQRQLSSPEETKATPSPSSLKAPALVREQKINESKSGVHMARCEPIFDLSTDTHGLSCSSDEGVIYVYPKQFTPSKELTINDFASEQTPLTGDTYDLSTCRAISFHGNEAVFCEGKKTNIFYHPSNQHGPEQFFNQLYGQAALALVFIQVGKNIYNWYYQKPELPQKINYLSAEDGTQALGLAYRKLAKIKRESPHHDWLDHVVEDYLETLENFEWKNNQGKLSRENVDNLNDNLDYTLASVSKASQIKVHTETKKALHLLSNKSKLTRIELHNLSKYFAEIARQSDGDYIEVSDTLFDQVKAIQKRLGYSVERLHDIAENYLCIKNIIHNSAGSMESDLIDIHESIDKINMAKEISPSVSSFQQDIDFLNQASRSLFHFLEPSASPAPLAPSIGFFSSLPLRCMDPKLPPSIEAISAPAPTLLMGNNVI